MRTAILALCVASLLPVHGALAQQDFEELGDWNYLDAQDALSGTDRSVAFGLSSDENLAFGFQCIDGQPRAVVFLRSVTDQLRMASAEGAEQSGEVTYRLDDRAPVGPHEWRYESDDAVLMASPAQTRRLLKRIGEHQKVGVRVFDPEGEEIRTDVLSLRGAERACSRLPCVE